MSKIFLSLIFTALSINTFSQKVYFIYLQSEAELPFIVKMNDKSISSSKSGYHILSKLKDSSYSFNIRFPENKWPEQKFSVNIGALDHGYLLKNFAEKGWGLFDLQTSVVQMSKAEEVNRVQFISDTEVSRFTEILAKAVDDSSLKQKQLPPIEDIKKPEVVIATAELTKEVIDSTPEQKPVPLIEEAKKPEVVIASIEKKEEPKTIVAEPGVIIKEERKSEQNPVPQEKKLNTVEKTNDYAPVLKVIESDHSKTTEYKKSNVSRKSESSTSDGFGLVFIDEYDDGTKDTISILIPNPKPLVKELITEPQEQKKVIEIIADTISLPVKNLVFEVKDTSRQEGTAVTQNEVIHVKPGLNKCSVSAEENDFLELRKKMASALNDEGMIDEARKYFKLKCFATAQIKNLGYLFLKDEWKYRFFDIAFTAVSDTDMFSSLQSELKDEYYINRFKSIQRN